MKFNINEITVKSLVMLFIKLVIILAIAGIVMEIVGTVLPVLIGLAVGFVIYRCFRLHADKKNGISSDGNAQQGESFGTGGVNLTK